MKRCQECRFEISNSLIKTVNFLHLFKQMKYYNRILKYRKNFIFITYKRSISYKKIIYSDKIKTKF